MRVKELIRILENLDPDMEVVVTDKSDLKYLSYRATYDIDIKQCKCYNDHLLVNNLDQRDDFTEWAISRGYYSKIEDRRDEVWEEFRDGLEDIALIELRRQQKTGI